MGLAGGFDMSLVFVENIVLLTRVVFFLLFLVVVCAAKTQGQSGHREVAVTFDDLPATNNTLEGMRGITVDLLRSMRKHGIPAVGFVNEGKLHFRREREARTELLRSWLEAGLELGNHTFSHISIDRADFEAYKDDVVKGERIIRELLAEKGKQLRYFRHTQLRTGPTREYKRSLDSLLAARRYTVAPVTIDNNEYVFAGVYARAKRRNDSLIMQLVIEKYVGYMETVFAHFEQLSRSLLGYEVRQVLLLHANELNADHFDDLVQMMKHRGYRFISLEEALKDPAYRLPEAQSTRGLSWLHRWRLAKGESIQPEPDVPEEINHLFRTYEP